MFKTFCYRLLILSFVLLCACSGEKASLSEGQQLLEKKEYNKALKWYDKNIEDEKNTEALKELYYQRALVHHQMSKFDLALSDINWALVIDSSNAVYLAEKGDLYFAKHMLADATDQYQKAIQADPEEGKWYYKSGTCRILKEEIAQAITELEKAEQLGYEDADLYLQQGIAYQRQGPSQQEKYCKAFKKSASMGNTEAQTFAKNLGCQ